MVAPVPGLAPLPGVPPPLPTTAANAPSMNIPKAPKFKGPPTVLHRYKPYRTMRTFHWSMIPKKRIQGTIFEDIVIDERSIKIDVDILDRLWYKPKKIKLSKRARRARNEKPPQKKQPSGHFINDGWDERDLWKKRSLCGVLAMKRTAVECANEVLNVNKIEDLELLRLLSGIMPDAEQFSTFLNHPIIQRLENEEKDNVDDYYLSLNKFAFLERVWYEIRNIPSPKKRCEHWMFKTEFESLVQFEYEHVNLLNKLYKNMWNNEQFKKIAELILFIGNYLNFGNKRLGLTEGFTPNVFAQLKDYKGNGCNVYNLLVFLVEMVNLNYPDLLHWTDMFDGASIASKLDTDHVRRDIDNLSHRIQEIESDLSALGGAPPTDEESADIYVELMIEWIINAKKDIRNLVNDWDQSVTNCGRLARYYRFDTTGDQWFDLRNMWYLCVEIEKDWKKVYEIESLATTLVFGWIREMEQEYELSYRIEVGIIKTICRHFPKWDLQEIIDVV